MGVVEINTGPAVAVVLILTLFAIVALALIQSVSRSEHDCIARNGAAFCKNLAP